ncbi:50S ribosomal protein L1 [Enterobacteriaceae endosymbiont of Donacia tomentosa]|uniref:50S ribosomal protein L1 n=1 Tax=Enterobacteriaceae endosymbiont of Donacia tomentosa TaxID=2675787 RepID=UPI00144976DA|nr:50S ribosomal protein L1 [Enterobacteriaceae endosymbiont of Donacia tomentosa]QJC31751.1 50S ribosomal protein L1 [Enterobacteriaceae endosymbiont of Donacia tomentosa]
MSKLTKRMNLIHKKINLKKQFSIEDAIINLKTLSTVKFNETIDVAINLSIDTKKSDQNIRGNVFLPHGTGKYVRVAVFADSIEAKQAKIEGAEFVGMEDLAKRITDGEKNFDVVIATLSAMKIVSKLGPILGPKGLMPNPKLGTVTNNVKETIKKIKNGQINYRNDKNGIIHTSIGKINFNNTMIKENLICLLTMLKKNRPLSLKNNFFKKICISSTMGVAINITKDCMTFLN